MNWEAVTAIATAFTGLVILVTALVAFREVRLAGEHAQALRDQLEHLRNATRFEGALAVFKDLDTPIQIDARRFVNFELAGCMKDEAFLREVRFVAGADENVHKELTVLRCFERIGGYARKGWIDPDTVYVVASGRVIIAWERLKDVVAIHREMAGAAFWNNFEELYFNCKSYLKDSGIKIEAVERRADTAQPRGALDDATQQAVPSE